MGIVNVTQDSFSDGGRFFDPQAAILHGQELLRAGARIIDVGAESTRPGYQAVDAVQEWQRLAPVLEGLANKDALLSVDTMKADVAHHALQNGAAIVNDVWGLQRDPEMAKVVAEHNALLVAMHNRADVDEALNLKADWKRFFDKTLDIAQNAGIPLSRIALDPGVGFGKTQTQNIQAVRELGILKEEYGLPVLLGLSRKSVLGWITGQPATARLAATIAANIRGMNNGAAILRVHDVQEHIDALKVWAAMDGKYD
ncbi:dihydropteroate synthase [Neokomagataea tanensis]|uniref:dihydropteroate synthase n=2 Tax=Neokomagataea TaxID=1223423 RepID=A0A4Y6V9A6_9PROT|nr:dihydropteroate synthase [Neokomagataea tanensis]